MPLKLTVGLSKKVGQPDYGSLGASCHVEVELDSSLLHGDLAAFQQRVRHAYAACGQAVDEELGRRQSPEPNSNSNSSTLANGGLEPTNGTNAIHHNNNGNVRPTQATNTPHTNGRPTSSRRPPHLPSDKQLDYLAKLAKQIHGLGESRLDEFATRMLGKPVSSTNAFEASALIDQLKAIKDGVVRLEDVMHGSQV